MITERERVRQSSRLVRVSGFMVVLGEGFRILRLLFQKLHTHQGDFRSFCGAAETDVWIVEAQMA